MEAEEEQFITDEKEKDQNDENLEQPAPEEVISNENAETNVVLEIAEDLEEPAPLQEAPSSEKAETDVVIALEENVEEPAPVQEVPSSENAETNVLELEEDLEEPAPLEEVPSSEKAETDVAIELDEDFEEPAPVQEVPSSEKAETDVVIALEEDLEEPVPTDPQAGQDAEVNLTVEQETDQTADEEELIDISATERAVEEEVTEPKDTEETDVAASAAADNVEDNLETQRTKSSDVTQEANIEEEAGDVEKAEDANVFNKSNSALSESSRRVSVDDAAANVGVEVSNDPGDSADLEKLDTQRSESAERENSQLQNLDSEETVVGKDEEVKPSAMSAASSRNEGEDEIQLGNKPSEKSEADVSAAEVMVKKDEMTKEGHEGSASVLSATVKLFLSEENILTLALPLNTSIQELRSVLASRHHVPADYISIVFNGEPVDGHFTIEQLGIEANGTVAFEVSSTDPKGHPLKGMTMRAPVDMADVITVRIVQDDCTVQTRIVEIERVSIKKPFLGGYRHKKTGIEYHHASAQTRPKPRPPPKTELFSRDTQTVENQHRFQSTAITTCTQMTKPGCYVANTTDKLVVPGKYETADEYNDRVFKKVITIQKYYRRWLAQQRVLRLKKQRDSRIHWEEDEELRKRREKADRIRQQFERRMHPKSQKDFEILFNALEKWRFDELNRINTDLTGAERKAALCILLDQETELLSAIGRHEIDAFTEHKDFSIRSLLGKAAAPKKWKNKKGDAIEMDTPYTLRGRELLDIYNSLNMKYLTQDERLDVLLTLKHTVKEHDCKLTQEIITLVDREADLLMRGVHEENLIGLRKRIITLFLQYCKTPTFNPEISWLLKVPPDPNALRGDIFYCRSCGRYLRNTEFALGIKSSTMGQCKNCLRKDNQARMRQDKTPYREILALLRQSEENRHDGAKMAFLVEENDVRYLVDNIWEGRSILSNWTDLGDLVLTRWKPDEEWSPWNTTLITKDEAEAHMKLEDIDSAYGDMLIHRINQKLVIARNYFRKLVSMAAQMTISRALPSELEQPKQTAA